MENITEENNKNPQSAFMSEETPENAKLKSAWQLFGEAWNLYHSKFKTLIGIMILPVVLSIILKELSILSISSPTLSQVSWLSMVKIIVWLILLYSNAISISALLFSIKDDIGTKEAYVRAIKSGFSYILVLILGLLAITGGFMLLTIPGILFSIWFSLAIYSFVFEDKKGMEALYRSKQLVSGNFWKVVWRSLFISIIALIIIIPLVIIAKVLKDTNGFTYNLLPLFITPLVIFFEALLFQDLVQVKQDSILQEPSKFGKFVYYFSMVIGVPIILGIFSLQGLFFITHDIPSPNDADLQLSAVNIPKENNALFALSEINDKVYWPTGQDDKLNNILSGKDWDDSLANDILQKNQQTLNSFEKGVALPVFQLPELQNRKDFNANTIISGMSSLRNLAKVNSIQALSLFKQGKEKEAFDQSIKTVKMAQMVQDGQNGLVGYLIGIATKEIAMNNLVLLIKDSHLSSAELLSYASELNKYKESKLALQKTLKGEYIMVINSKEQMFDPAFRGQKPTGGDDLGLGTDVPAILTKSNFYYQPNRTKLLFMETYRGFVDNAGKNNYTEINHVEKKPVTWLIVFTDNAIGKILSNIISVSFDSLFAKRFEENLSVKETQLLLALKAYRQDNSSLPESLNDLVPKYISEIPQDPFDGKTIKYSPEKKIIYSTGKDLIDNGGSISESDWRQGDDLGFKIDF